MTTLHCIDLSGFRGHHPLAFLAACGLLRIVGESFPARLGWSTDHTSGCWIAALRIQTKDVQPNSLRHALVNLIGDSAAKFLRDLDVVGIQEAEALPADFRSWNEVALARKQSVDLLPAIGSDVLQRRKNSGKNKGKLVVKTTHLAMTSGQQDLISGARKLAEKLAKRSSQGEIPETIRKRIEEALFGPWSYQDDEHSLGWDPNTQRLHALRNKAPTIDNKNRSVSGAVFLATQALPLFPCFARGRRLETTGFHRDDDGEEWFSWPIWRHPISLGTLRSLLTHQFTGDLKGRGVEVVYRCRRVRTGGAEGNYQTFSHAQERPWPRARRGGRSGINV